MKLPLIIVFSSLLICSFGCVTKPLSIGEHGLQLAEPLELELADITFLNYCGYRIIPTTQTESFSPNPGIIAATNTDLSVATGNLRSAGKKEVIKISMDEIDGFAEIGNQLQIKFDDQLLVLFINSMYPFELDYGREKELVDLLNKNAVPRYEAEFAYNKRRRSSHSSEFVDVPQNNYEGAFADSRQYPYTSQDGSVYNTGGNTRSTP